MCGIAGYIGKQELSQDKIQATLDRMKNRGPDNQDFETFSDGVNSISLLHSRLSIIDLEERSNQPFRIGDYLVIFNGEIYNYVELRKELENDNIALRTNCDTEVLLQYYIKYGEDCVKYFEGMWAFAIYDPQNKKLFLSRDRFAEKPLYYFETREGFFFASETAFLKTLQGEELKVNYDQVMRYLVNGYRSLYKAGQTYYQDIHELDFAVNMVIGQSLKIKSYQYWKPERREVKMSIDEAIEETRRRLIESMRIRLRSDVPVAFCLSGGVDSAGLVSIASKEFNQKVKTYSIIDKDERYNEYDNIRATLDDTKCESVLIELDSETDNVERLEQLINYHDAPIATISYLIHAYLSEQIAQDGCKVVFSGTSADEIFTGYYDHFNLHLYEMRNRPDYSRYLKDWKCNTGKVVRNPYLKNPELYFDDPNFRNHIYLNNDEFSSYLINDFSESFTETKFCDSLLHNRMMNELLREGSRVILHEDDLNSMKYSIENRSPYLDTKLVDFAYSIPTEYLIMDGYGKYVLRQALNGILNDQVRLDRRKKGFNAAISSLINLKNREIKEYLLNKNANVFDIIHRHQIEKLLEMEDIPNSYSKFIFNFINLRIFLN